MCVPEGSRLRGLHPDVAACRHSVLVLRDGRLVIDRRPNCRRPELVARTVDPERHRARRRAILDAAASVFAAHGFAGTTTGC